LRDAQEVRRRRSITRKEEGGRRKEVCGMPNVECGMRNDNFFIFTFLHFIIFTL
jgi:hypothetical protein